MKSTKSITFIKVFLNVFNIPKNYNNYKGRARRTEFWYTTLICIVMLLAIDYLSYLAGKTWGEIHFIRIIDVLISAYFFITNYACMCRRMHDIGRSCVYPGLTLISALVAFTCLMLSQDTVVEVFCIIFTSVTALLLAYTLFLCTKDSDRGKNRYGDSSKYITI